MTDPPLFTLEIKGTEELSWRIARVRGREMLHAPFRFDVIAVPLHGMDHADLHLEDLVTKPAKLAWADGTRTIEGIVDEVSRTEDHYEIAIVPRVALLADAIDHKVFVDKDVIAIATSILGEHGVTLDSKVQRTLTPRPQCVQAFESDLAFVSRILADEGISWYVSPTEKDIVVATDHADGYPKIETILPVLESGGMATTQSVYEAEIVRNVVPDKVSLRDYNFKTPQVELKAQAGDEGDIEEYQYPGGFTDPTEGRTVAKLRLEEGRARARVLSGTTTSRELAAGRTVKLEGELPGVTDEWLVLEVTHEGRVLDTDEAHERYSARFVATPKATPYRPARMPAPQFDGVQNATTTGPPSQDLHTDEHARVKAQLRWDRLGKKDDKSSTWVRTLQPPTSGGFMLPRVGWEVLLGFCGTSADAPFVLGRMSNGAAPPPQVQPGNKTQSAFGSLTTPGGGTKNLIMTTDSGGAEKFEIVASYDLNEKTENDKVTAVKGNETDSVAVNRTLIVGQVHTLNVIGSQTHTVGANRDLNVDANMQVTAAAESISVGAVRTFKVGGDSTIACKTLARTIGAMKVETAIEHQTRSVTGASSILVGGSWNAVGGVHASVSVGGASSESVGGPKRVTTKKDYVLSVKGSLSETLASRTTQAGSKIEENYKASATVDISGDVSMKGADIIVVASDKITLTADGITVEITSGAVKVKGKFEGSVGAVDDGDETYA
jgi:type VI secretion system secreted protein VgrG